MPNPGQPFPNFELPNQDGNPVRLSSFRGRRLILFAFPKALPHRRKAPSWIRSRVSLMVVLAVVKTERRNMTSPSIASATASEQQRVVSTIVMAFTADPIIRWVSPDPHQYLTYFAEFVALFDGKAFEHSTAYCADDFAAVSLWLPPGVHPDEEALGELLERGVAEGDQEKVFAFLEQMGVYHPTEPHWYLPLIGVDPVQQGRGLGSALLMHALQHCDGDKLPAYLEASTEGNRRLYQRHGFEQIAEIQVEDSPPMWPMLRKPR